MRAQQSITGSKNELRWVLRGENGGHVTVDFFSFLS